jgi:hypothetical protein
VDLEVEPLFEERLEHWTNHPVDGGAVGLGGEIETACALLEVFDHHYVGVVAHSLREQDGSLIRRYTQAESNMTAEFCEQ